MDALKQSVILSIEQTIRESRSAEWRAAAATQGTTAEHLAALLIYGQLFEQPLVPAVRPPAA